MPPGRSNPRRNSFERSPPLPLPAPAGRDTEDTSPCRRSRRACGSTALWVDGQAAEAAGFYVAIFKDARITDRDPARSQRVMEAMRDGQDRDIAALERAYARA